MPDEAADSAVPMSNPDISAADLRAVADVLRSGGVSAGPAVARFESAIASWLGAAHAAAVSSGTAGLHLALIAAGVERGDLVVTTPFSFVASANAILYRDAVPVFVDVDRRDGNIDAELAADAVADLTAGNGALLPPALPSDIPGGGRLKAVLPVHIFGIPADLEPLAEAARKQEAFLIEDACEALGSETSRGKVGSRGDAAVFGFYANKQITTGEGGMVVTRHPQWDALIRSLRNQGRPPSGDWLRHERIGFNYRLSALAAALGAAQMTRLEERIEKRTRVAGWYRERLGECGGLRLPPRPRPGEKHSLFAFVVRIQPSARRDDVRSKLAAAGIPSRTYFPAIHLLPHFRGRFGYRPGMFPRAEEWSDSALALPFSSVMDEGQVERVCQALRAARV